MTNREQELVIRIARDETEVTITGTGAYWTRQLEKLLTRVPGRAEVLSRDSYRVIVPLVHLRLLAPRRKRILTDEQRAQIGIRFKNSPRGVETQESSLFDEGGDSPDEASLLDDE